MHGRKENSPPTASFSAKKIILPAQPAIVETSLCIDMPEHRNPEKRGLPTWHILASTSSLLFPGRNLYELPLMRRHLFDRYSIVFHSFSVSQREK
jgi:hypothetical protein